MSKRFIVWLLAVALCFAAMNPHTAEAAAKPRIKGVSVTNVKGKKLTLVKGDTFQLKVKVKAAPDKKKYKKVLYSTSKKKIASVSASGKIKAKKAGTANITIRAQRDKKKKTVIRVTVKAENNVTPPTGEPSEPTKEPVPASSEPSATLSATETPVPTAVPTVTPKPDGKSTLMRKPFTNTAYVGKKLSDTPVEGGSILDSNGAEIAGTYTWENPDTKLEQEGKAFYMADFQPADSIFEKVTGIRIPVQIAKQPLFINAPKASAITTSQKLSESKLTGGSAVDASGKTVSGHFEWNDETAVIGIQGSRDASVVFVPDDAKTYQRTSFYVRVRTTGTSLNRKQQDKVLNISSGKWKNDEAYSRDWTGSVYNLQPYLSGVDMSLYGRVTVKIKLYDRNGNVINGMQNGFAACKLSSAENDWTGFVDTWTVSEAALSLGKYSGGALYLVVQNSSANIAYIEVVSITLNAKLVSNIYDGSNLTRLYGEMFGKVGVAVVRHELESGEVMDFCKSQFNSVTLGNEMKPDYVLGGSPTLLDSNPSGYVDTAGFRFPYKDTKYPKIDMDAIDSMIKTAYANGMKMRYHVFIWHHQSPRWFFKENFSAGGKYVSEDVMNGRLEYLVRNVMTHVYNLKDENGVYIGREVIDSWDIANEYFHNSDGDYKSYWDEVYYPDYSFKKDRHSGITNPVYIKMAFAIARSVLEDCGLSEKVSLLSNDFNTYDVTDNIISMIHYFNTKDEINPDGEVICDGVGMQMHLDIGYPSVNKIRETLEKFKNAGLEIQITELDVTSYSKTEEYLEKQNIYWYQLMRTIVEERGSGAKITGITWWGPDDKNSWRSDGVPLLFSDYWQAKDSYFRAAQALSDYCTGEEWEM